MRLELPSHPIRLNFMHKPDKELVVIEILSGVCPQGTDLFEDLEVNPLIPVCAVGIRSKDISSMYQKETHANEELWVA